MVRNLFNKTAMTPKQILPHRLFFCRMINFGFEHLNTDLHYDKQIYYILSFLKVIYLKENQLFSI